ncbi:hypothetical protein HGM15179_010100 [Zosterops borbonicus]|uniref:Uncharacterized protein n=1 Tax=Zosterops borbonicus TaxID=364589 RepID=A0A8K1GFF3_9PASS|nr:hypothetical protein HGM15179_010100 [Zosterops borbonicus]
MGLDSALGYVPGITRCGWCSVFGTQSQGMGIPCFVRITHGQIHLDKREEKDEFRRGCGSLSPPGTYGLVGTAAFMGREPTWRTKGKGEGRIQVFTLRVLVQHRGDVMVGAHPSSGRDFGGLQHDPDSCCASKSSLTQRSACGFNLFITRLPSQSSSSLLPSAPINVFTHLFSLFSFFLYICIAVAFMLPFTIAQPSSFQSGMKIFQIGELENWRIPIFSSSSSWDPQQDLEGVTAGNLLCSAAAFAVQEESFESENPSSSAYNAGSTFPTLEMSTALFRSPPWELQMVTSVTSALGQFVVLNS